MFRTSKWAIAAYEFVSETALPLVFILLTGITFVFLGLTVLSLADRAIFDLLSTMGMYCTSESKNLPKDHDEKLGTYDILKRIHFASRPAFGSLRAASTASKLR
jgi:hypothetical protein